MVFNFRTREISRSAHKLMQLLLLITKKKNLISDILVGANINDHI